MWELLHQGRLTLLTDGEIVPREGWQEVVLDWATWTAPLGEGAHALRVPVDGALG